MAENKKYFSEFLEKFFKEKGYNLEYVAKMTGASVPATSHYKTGRRIPKDDFIDAFIKAFVIGEKTQKEIRRCVALDRTPDIIKEELKSNVRIVDDEEFIELPIKAIASAGSGYMNFEIGYDTVKIKKNGFNENCYVIEVSGDSMFPKIPNGAHIVVDPRETEIINNKIYVVEYLEEMFIKKVELNDDIKGIILKSINPEYKDIYIVGELLKEIRIKGRAVRVLTDEAI